MNKTIKIAATALVCVGFFVALGTGCSRKSSNVEALDSGQDSISYVIGCIVGREILKMDSTLNVEVLCKAIADGYDNRSKMSDEQMRDYYLRYVNYALPEIAKAHESTFLEERTDRSYKRTKSGLVYKIINDGDLKNTPSTDTENVWMRYKLENRYGDVVYSSYMRGDTLQTQMKKLIPGIKEGVRLIGKKGKIELWIPFELGYGKSGNAEYGVKANETLHAEVELINFTTNK